MATPLAQLLQDVIHEPEIRAQFAASPESFLADHGYEHLDAADLREALYALADGAAPDAAAGYQAAVTPSTPTTPPSREAWPAPPPACSMRSPASVAPCSRSS